MSGTDELASVMAGSALWLDCTRLVQPIESLIYVTWSRNYDVIYHQQYVDSNNVGFPANSTVGHVVGGRMTSQSVGQVSVWPIAPGEDGVYTCTVYMANGNQGRTFVRRKTVAVFVGKNNCQQIVNR